MVRWPDAATVRNALTAWATRAGESRRELLAVGLFGSYARGDWGVGSDADVVLIVASSNRPFVERARDWDLNGLPVPADVLVYDGTEWERLAGEETRFAHVLRAETIWVWRREAGKHVSEGPFRL